MLIENFIIYFNGEQLPADYWANLTDGAQPEEVKFFADIELNDIMKRHVLDLDIDNQVVEAYLQQTLDTEGVNEFFIASGMGNVANDDIWSIVKAIYVSPFSNETPNDITGNGNNPVVSGDTVTYGAGLIGKSLVLSGTNNLKFNNNIYGNDQLSVDIWFNASDLSGTAPKYLFVNSNNVDIWCKLLLNADRDLVLTVKTSDGAEFTSTPIENIAEGAWHHVVVEYNNLDRFDIYHNGNIGGSLDINPVTPYAAQDFTYFGSDDDESNAGRFIGSFDEIRIIQDMVDASSINAEYNLSLIHI